MDRVLVSGISGSGKTTLARELSRRLSLPYTELDSLHHGRGWVKRPEFEADVDHLSAQPRWVSEEQYQTFLGTVLLERADTYVWLDLPRWLVMQRVIRRSVGRAISGRPLWNGNREDWRRWADADHPIRWAWAQHAPRRRRVAEQLADPRFAHLTVHHLRTPSDVRRFLAAVTPGRTGIG